nr:unnamed protein product [Digitaria exilis]
MYKSLIFLWLLSSLHLPGQYFYEDTCLMIEHVFFRQLLVLFLMHSTALSLFRCVVSYCQTAPVSSVGSTLSLLFILLCGGFVIPRTLVSIVTASMPNWLKWVFWISPMSYGEISLTGNEFLTPRWKKVMVSGDTIGKSILMDRGLDFSSIFYWISVGALILFILLLNIGFTIGLTTIRRTSQALVSRDKLTIIQGKDFEDMVNKRPKTNLAMNSFVTGKAIPFKPLAISFRDVNYYVDAPMLMLIKRGGKLIYAGPLGHNSCKVIQYFQAIPGVPMIKENYNPSTWMLEVTSPSTEAYLGVDLAQIYRESSLYK